MKICNYTLSVAKNDYINGNFHLLLRGSEFFNKKKKKIMRMKTKNGNYKKFEFSPKNYVKK